MRGNAGPLTLILFLLGLFGALAWLTRHPDAEIVRRAESWPFVGPLASELRQRYVPPAPPSAPEGAAAAAHEITAAHEVTVVEPAVPPVGDGFVWVLPGTAMHREPSATSQKILQFDAIANVIRLERRGDWFRIWRRGREGWVRLEGYQEDGPPYGSDPDPPRPLPSRAPDEAALAAARGFLEGGGRALSAGPYALYTDSDDGELLAHLDRVAAGLEDAYAERFGLRPADEEVCEAVVLFEREAAYRRVQSRSERLLGLAASGHTASGLMVLYAGGRPRWEVTATFVHELVHTLNRRSLGPALPCWLDEGLAEDLSTSTVDAGGRIMLGSVGGERQRAEGRETVYGGAAALVRLREAAAAGRLRSVDQLVALDWDAFVRDDAPLNYAAATFWVRFLLAAEDGRYADAFHGYLEGVAAGEPATPEALRERLGLSWSVANARFLLWLEFWGPTPVTLDG
jgi:hypothetical protein